MSTRKSLLASALLVLLTAFSWLPKSHAFVVLPGAPVTCKSFGSTQPLRVPLKQTKVKNSVATHHKALPWQQEGDGGRPADENIVSKMGLSTPLDRPLLATVDFLALLGFATVGKASHSAVDGSIDFLAVLAVAFPFLLSWFATSPLTGVYTSQSTQLEEENPFASPAVAAAKGWVIAIPLGIALRGVIKGYVPPTPFIIVTMIATLVILCGSRVAFALVQDFVGKVTTS